MHLDMKEAGIEPRQSDEDVKYRPCSGTAYPFVEEAGNEHMHIPKKAGKERKYAHPHVKKRKENIVKIAMYCK